jgi:hypothetical protein
MRRALVGGIGISLAAPAIVRTPGLLMRVPRRSLVIQSWLDRMGLLWAIKRRPGESGAAFRSRLTAAITGCGVPERYSQPLSAIGCGLGDIVTMRGNHFRITAISADGIATMQRIG